MWFGVSGTKKYGTKVIPLNLLTRLGLSLIPDGKLAPMAPTAAKIDRKPAPAHLLDLLA